MSVYFIQYNDLIKIGDSSRIASRVSDLMTAIPGHASFLGHMPGDRDVERHLHTVFHETRFSGEWFMATPELVGLIRLLAIPDMPTAEMPTVVSERAVLDEQWHAMSVRFREAAARRWPTDGHQDRKAKLAQLLGWGTRRVKSLYEGAPGMTLRQHEADALQSLLFVTDAEKMQPGADE